jgi:hypothetical protein
MPGTLTTAAPLIERNVTPCTPQTDAGATPLRQPPSVAHLGDEFGWSDLAQVAIRDAVELWRIADCSAPRARA